MVKGSTNSPAVPALLVHLFALLRAHRPAFGQARPYQRAVGLLWGELFSFGRHTVTQALLALGLNQADWSAWYRLFSRGRVDEARLADCLLAQTLLDAPPEQPYVVVVDSTQVPRTSLRLPGSSWLPAPSTAPFRRGLHRAQRFLTGAWLTPLAGGYSRAIPLRLLPAFTPHAVPAPAHPPRTEWQAALEFLGWVRHELDHGGREDQPVVVLADGAFDRLGFWAALPERVVGLVRTAKNRALYELPSPHPGRGRPARYGARARTPQAYLHERQRRWETHQVAVRGHARSMRVSLAGPLVRDGLPAVPLFLLLVKGSHRRHPAGPAYYLISAVAQADGQWVLPLPLAAILAWLWQRWEVEVAHREMKSGVGLGEKQCWGARSAVASVQWGAWVYALLVLAAYRSWGLAGGPRAPTRWWGGGGRWSFTSMWRAYRGALGRLGDFSPTWPRISANWDEKELWLATLSNALIGAARI